MLEMLSASLSTGGSSDLLRMLRLSYDRARGLLKRALGLLLLAGIPQQNAILQPDIGVRGVQIQRSTAAL